MTSLEGWSSTIELRPRRMLRISRGQRVPSLDGPQCPRDVGEAGFEPATSCSQSRRAAKLRYSPFRWPSLVRGRSGAEKCHWKGITFLSITTE